MKRWLFAVMTVIMTVSFASCGKDDEPEHSVVDEPELSVVGVWRQDFSGGYQLLSFEKNGKYSLVEIDYNNDHWSVTGTYTIKGDVMTLWLDCSEVEVYTIMTLTQTKLITRYEGSYIGEYGNQYSNDDYDDWTRVE